MSFMGSDTSVTTFVNFKQLKKVAEQSYRFANFDNVRNNEDLVPSLRIKTMLPNGFEHPTPFVQTVICVQVFGTYQKQKVI